MWIYILKPLILVSWLQVFAAADAGDHEGMLTVTLQHALDHVIDPEFSSRGKISIHNIQTESSALQQASLSAADKQRLKDLALFDGLYRLKAVVQTSDGKQTTFYTFTKACSLVESQLSDIITISLNHANNVIAVSMSTPISVCQGIPISNDDLRFFNTTVAFRHMDTGPTPDTATYIQKLEREKEARERGEAKDNRSFLAKYWMYIVPVMIFVLLSGAANPEGAGGGGGR